MVSQSKSTIQNKMHPLDTVLCKYWSNINVDRKIIIFDLQIKTRLKTTSWQVIKICINQQEHCISEKKTGVKHLGHDQRLTLNTEYTSTACKPCCIQFTAYAFIKLYLLHSVHSEALTLTCGDCQDYGDLSLRHGHELINSSLSMKICHLNQILREISKDQHNL